MLEGALERPDRSLALAIFAWAYPANASFLAAASSGEVMNPSSFIESNPLSALIRPDLAGESSTGAQRHSLSRSEHNNADEVERAGRMPRERALERVPWQSMVRNHMASEHARKHRTKIKVQLEPISRTTNQLWRGRLWRGRELYTSNSHFRWWWNATRVSP